MRGAMIGAIASSAIPAPSVTPVEFLASFAPLTATNNFNMGLTASGALDLSAYTADDLALVVALNWYANGGGPITYSCSFEGAPLDMMVGMDRSGGANWGCQLWVLPAPAATGTLSATATGTANTGRNLWVSASLFANVGGWEAGTTATIASGVAHSIALGAGEYAVNAMAAGQAMSNYSQTRRQYSTIGNLRGACGDATGEGTLSFSCTGGNYNSALARLLPA
ncbi:hypothetical protein L2K20_09985 [Mycobacterium sp. MBM]|nr:hypothetical protein [Mycobacterium sp. MBM]